MINQILIIAGVILLFWLFRTLFPARHKPHLQNAAGNGGPIQHGGLYQAVSVHSYKGSCQAAEGIRGTRFLTNEAPPIPLKNCNADKCHCVYWHHEDRRSGENTRRKKHEPGDEFLETPGYEDRRNAKGRRTSDLLAA